MSGRCATCKHWDSSDPSKTDRRCLAVPHKSDALNSLAYVQDVEDYSADLITRAEFGCVLHEGRVVPYDIRSVIAGRVAAYDIRSAYPIVKIATNAMYGKSSDAWQAQLLTPVYRRGKALKAECERAAKTLQAAEKELLGYERRYRAACDWVETTEARLDAISRAASRAVHSDGSFAKGEASVRLYKRHPQHAKLTATLIKAAEYRNDAAAHYIRAQRRHRRAFASSVEVCARYSEFLTAKLRIRTGKG